MPIRYEWTPEQQQQAEAANQWLMDAIAKAMPGSAYLGQETYQPLTQPIANAVLPKTLEDAMNAAFNTIGVGPLEIYPNYRTPEAIQGLRRLMAEEQRARGPMAQTHPMSKVFPGMTRWDTLSDDPADLILRGTWFHGESPAARTEVTRPFQTPYGFTQENVFPSINPDFARRGFPFTEDVALPVTNEYGLPGSTHAIPGGYVRFGEPYGVSLTASPSIAAKFAADENIHRVMPLYGGPPTERTLQLWKPEHQRRFNEAYNEALNKWLSPQGISSMIKEEYGWFPDKPDYSSRFRQYLEDVGKENPETVAWFNNAFSNTLQNQGVRGLLYNPRRYGEYEMLMLDPKWAQPLDYRAVGEYQKTLPSKRPASAETIDMTPGMRQGYMFADPEFAANHARLSDMFGLMPWTERINPENWQRIMEQVDPAYRDAIVNQLFGNR